MFFFLCFFCLKKKKKKSRPGNPAELPKNRSKLYLTESTGKKAQ